jgi:O-antigen/teichoic acid export membrane protein
LLLPAYTRALDPSEYGTLGLLLAFAGAAAIIFSVGLDVAIFRLFFQLEEEPERQQQLVLIIWCLLMFFPIAAALALGLGLWPVVGDSHLFTNLELLLVLVGAALGVAATTLPFSVLRAQQRLRAYLGVTGAATVTNAALTLLFVVGLDWGVGGWLVATILANAATLVVAALVLPFRAPTWPIDTALVRHSLGFGAPLVPHSLAHWGLQLADRAILAGLVGAAALGVYSLASNLALAVLVLVQSLNYGFMPAYARAGTRGSDSELDHVVILQATLVGFVCVGGALLGPPMLDLVAPDSYGSASDLIPWIALGYGFLGLYYIPMNGISLGGGRTRFVSLATLSAAGTNVVLLYLLVPDGGLRAAAIASAIGYAVLLVAVFIYARRPENPVRYHWKALFALFALLTATYAAGRLTTGDEGIGSLAGRTLLLVAAALLVVAVRTGSRTLGAHVRASLRALITR